MKTAIYTLTFVIEILILAPIYAWWWAHPSASEMQLFQEFWLSCLIGAGVAISGPLLAVIAGRQNRD